MTTPLWADADEVERRHWDADPERHDVPNLCICSHDRDEHTRTEWGCSHDCGCPWFDAEPPAWTDLDEYEPEHYMGAA